MPIRLAMVMHSEEARNSGLAYWSRRPGGRFEKALALLSASIENISGIVGTLHRLDRCQSIPELGGISDKPQSAAPK
jgi:hypothetical protein